MVPRLPKMSHVINLNSIQIEKKHKRKARIFQKRIEVNALKQKHKSIRKIKKLLWSLRCLLKSLKELN